MLNAENIGITFTQMEISKQVRTLCLKHTKLQNRFLNHYNIDYLLSLAGCHIWLAIIIWLIHIAEITEIGSKV